MASAASASASAPASAVAESLASPSSPLEPPLQPPRQDVHPAAAAASAPAAVDAAAVPSPAPVAAPGPIRRVSSRKTKGVRKVYQSAQDDCPVTTRSRAFTKSCAACNSHGPILIPCADAGCESLLCAGSPTSCLPDVDVSDPLAVSVSCKGVRPTRERLLLGPRSSVKRVAAMLFEPDFSAAQREQLGRLMETNFTSQGKNLGVLAPKTLTKEAGAAAAAAADAVFVVAHGHVAHGDRGLLLRLPVAGAVHHRVESKGERQDATPVELLDHVFPRGPPTVVVLMTCGSAVPQQVLALQRYCAQHPGATVVLALRRKAADDAADGDDRVGLVPLRVLPVLASALGHCFAFTAVRLVDSIERFAASDVRQHAAFTVVTADSVSVVSDTQGAPMLRFVESAPPKPELRPVPAGGARPYPSCSSCKRSLKYKGKDKAASVNKFCCMTSGCLKQKQLVLLR